MGVRHNNVLLPDNPAQAMRKAFAAAFSFPLSRQLSHNVVYAKPAFSHVNRAVSAAVVFTRTNGRQTARTFSGVPASEGKDCSRPACCRESDRQIGAPPKSMEFIGDVQNAHEVIFTDFRQRLGQHQSGLGSVIVELRSIKLRLKIQPQGNRVRGDLRRCKPHLEYDRAPTGQPKSAQGKWSGKAAECRPGKRGNIHQAP